MILCFFLPDTEAPVGGVKMQYELANALARRGHEVHVGHYPPRPPDWEPTSWFAFDPRVRRYYTATDFDEANPDFRGDFRFTDALDDRFGLPLVFVQHSGLYAPAVEERRLWAPCPKLCRSRWLVEVARERGVPADELFHLRPGLDHATYELLTPLEDRPPVVSMLGHVLPVKGVADGLAALQLVRDEVPELEVVVFGIYERLSTLPAWVTYVEDPPVEVLVREVYNRSRVFLCPSLSEGFGMPSIEAMACGAALVTTDNGGSRDFAVDGETALVCAPGDVEGMAARVIELLRDDDRRVRLATSGRRLVASFDWDATAAQVEGLLVEYGRHPDRFGRRRASAR